MMRAPAWLRRYTDPVLERIPVPVVGGENRGRLWNVASAGSGFGTGRRARTQMRVIRSLLRRGEVVWDVGAHHGYVTLMASRRVGGAGRVHSFEPDHRNARILERHLRWNRVRNATVHRYALGSEDGASWFGGDGTSKTMALGQGEDRVEVRRASSVVGSGAASPPSFVKIDVEGAEARVLDGALELIPGDARLVIAVHTAEADRYCVRLLESRGFALVASRGLERVRQADWLGDPDLLAFGPDWSELEVEGERERVRELGF